MRIVPDLLRKIRKIPPFRPRYEILAFGEGTSRGQIAILDRLGRFRIVPVTPKIMKYCRKGRGFTEARVRQLAAPKF